MPVAQTPADVLRSTPRTRIEESDFSSKKVTFFLLRNPDSGGHYE